MPQSMLGMRAKHYGLSGMPTIFMSYLCINFTEDFINKRKYLRESSMQNPIHKFVSSLLAFINVAQDGQVDTLAMQFKLFL